MVQPIRITTGFPIFGDMSHSHQLPIPSKSSFIHNVLGLHCEDNMFRKIKT